VGSRTSSSRTKWLTSGALFMIVPVLMVVSQPRDSSALGGSGESKPTIRTVKGVTCAYLATGWTAGVRRGSGFLSYKKLATSYLASSKRATGSTRTSLERLAGRAALDALSKQPTCSRLKNSSVTQEGAKSPFSPTTVAAKARNGGSPSSPTTIAAKGRNNQSVSTTTVPRSQTTAPSSGARPGGSMPQVGTVESIPSDGGGGFASIFPAPNSPTIGGGESAATFPAPNSPSSGTTVVTTPGTRTATTIATSPVGTTPTVPVSETTLPSTTTTPGPPPLAFPTACSTELDSRWDVEDGVGAAVLVRDIACAEAAPIRATGTPIKFGVMSPEGPMLNYPDYYGGISAGVDYVNEHLGGVGSNVSAGIAGRPIELTKCVVTSAPTSLTACASTLAASQPLVVVTPLNITDIHRPILAAAGIREIVGTPVVSQDFLSGNARVLGSPGCLSSQVGIVDYVDRVLGKRSLVQIAPSAATSRWCYRAGVVTAADVISGAGSGSSTRRGSHPTFAQVGVQYAMAGTSLSSAAELAFQTAASSIGIDGIEIDCGRLLSALSTAGWRPNSQTVVMAGSCYRKTRFQELGSAITGVRVIAPDNFYGEAALPIAAERGKFLDAQASIVDREMLRSAPAYRDAIFGKVGFNLGLRLWQAANRAAALGDLSGDGVFSVLDSMTNHVAFGGGRLSCGDAPSPYSSYCDHYVRAFRWDGENLRIETPLFSPLGLLAGTTLVDSTNPPDSRMLNP
jgi:hypothetical protein